MITDAAFADICLGSYDAAYVWDALSQANGVYVGIKRVDDLDVICFRGSETTEDWIRDLRAVPETTDHPELGPVHAGFFAGMEATAIWTTKQLRPHAEIAVTGHSLGAARAWLCAALMRAKSVEIERVCVFGSPRPGFPPLREVLKGISAVSYRNATPSGHDRVTDMPPAFAELPWTEPCPLTDINVPPVAGDRSPFRFHHMPLYRAGMTSPLSPVGAC